MMKTNQKKKKINRADNISGYLFIGVAMIIFIMFTLYPVISAVITSLQKYKPFGSEWHAHVVRIPGAHLG